MCLTVSGQWQAEHSGSSVPDNKTMSQQGVADAKSVDDYSITTW